MEDHYEVLGLSRTATLAEIKTAFRLRVRQTHPDSQPQLEGDYTEFLRVQAAYTTLSDADARRRYDRTLPSRSLAVIPDVPKAQPEQSEAMRHYNEAWDRYHRGEKAKPKAPPPPAMKRAFRLAEGESGQPRYVVFISLEEAFNGTKVNVEISKTADCPACQGTSVELVKGPDCSLCAGTGHAGQRGLVGRLLFGDPCQGCSGDGFVKVPRTCSQCYGQGHKTTSIRVVLDLVPGIRDGTVLSVPKTDSTLEVNVLPAKGFIRDGDTLRVSKLLKASSLTKGTTVSVRCLDGIKRHVRVPPGSADGSEIVLPRCGMPRVNSRDIGDLIVMLSARPEA